MLLEPIEIELFLRLHDESELFRVNLSLIF